MTLQRECYCKHCHQTFFTRTNGRPREYCDRLPCQREMRLTWGREYRQRLKEGYTPTQRRSRPDDLLPRAPEPSPKPVTWWVAQAMGIVETCEKCEGPVEGVYVAPTMATQGECAVVAHCRLCGRERMVLSGRMGVPYGIDNG